MSAGVLLGVLAAPVVGHADTSTDATPNQKTSTATVNIDAPSNGTLTLVSVPSFTFDGNIVNNYSGDNKISGKTKGNLVVDDQTGKAAGWTVAAQLDKFSTTSSSNSAAVLGNGGVYLGMGNMSATAPSSNPNSGAAPSIGNASLAADGSSVNVVTAKAATGVDGDKGQGSGEWDMSFSNPSLGAFVPWVKASYSASIAWTLTAGPTSN